MALSSFTPSVSGMEAQSHALQTVSTNFANMRTIGYKPNETMFKTLLGSTPNFNNTVDELSSNRVSINGVSYYDRTLVNKQGNITATGNNYDVAINGENAFFEVKDSGGNIFYTRAGDFTTMTQNGTTYLVTGSGYKVQGFPASGNSFGGTPTDIEIKYQEKLPSVATTKAEVIANVPADGVESSSYGVTVYGPNNDGRTMNMVFSKVEGKINTWEINFNIEDGTVNGGPIEAVFNADGTLLSPKNFDISVAWDDGTSNNIAMDISNMTQYAGSSGITKVEQDGAPSGNFVKSFIDENGIVKASYSNGKELNFAKLALVGFESADNLIPVNNTVFEASNDTGASHYVNGPDKNVSNLLQPQSVEASAVNVESEFAKMIVVQRAYSLNTQSFTANNEMLQTIVNLKS